MSVVRPQAQVLFHPANPSAFTTQRIAVRAVAPNVGPVESAFTIAIDGNQPVTVCDLGRNTSSKVLTLTEGYFGADGSVVTPVLGTWSRTGPNCSITLIGLSVSQHTVAMAPLVSDGTEGQSAVFAWEVAACGAGSMATIASTGLLSCSACPSGAECEYVTTTVCRCWEGFNQSPRVPTSWCGLFFSFFFFMWFVAAPVIFVDLVCDFLIASGCVWWCVVSGSLVTADRVIAKNGFWSSSNRVSSGDFYKCPIRGSCLGGTVTVTNSTDNTTVVVSECAQGYGGLLCAKCVHYSTCAWLAGVLQLMLQLSSCLYVAIVRFRRCLNGYFFQFGHCEQCPDSTFTAYVWRCSSTVFLGIPHPVVWCATSSVLFTTAVGMGMLMAAFVAWKMRKAVPEDASAVSSTMKIMLNLCQIVGIANAAYSIPWPQSVQSVMDVMEVSLLEVYKLARLNCSAPMNYFNRVTATLIGVKVRASMHLLCCSC